MGRADLASELRFTDGEEGLEFLRALSYVDIPWLKVGTEGQKRDRLETVYHRNMRGRSVALRCYDKGVESETSAPGARLRLERQRRWRKDQEGTVNDVIARGLAEQFVGRELRAVVLGEEEVMVCDPPAAADRLRELYARGCHHGRRTPSARRVRVVWRRRTAFAHGSASGGGTPSLWGSR